MIIIFLGIALAALAFAFLANRGANGYRDRHMISELVGMLGLGATGLCAILYCFLAWNWIAAEHKMGIINREYGTSYTQAEVFYGSDVIETVRQLDRKRYEVNGDLIRREGR